LESTGEGGLCLSCAGSDLEQALFGKSEGVAAAIDHPVIPGWKIKRLLSSGSMGQLWVAESEDDGHQAVIKLPVAGESDDDEILERFETEAELLSRLTHENILELEDIGTAEDGRLFFVTEYVEGCDLRRLMRAETLPAERSLQIFFKVCDAMIYAHGQGVVHRDLKPSNILVASDGTVKVADFGLAKDAAVVASDGRTSAGDGLGTPYYLAPESMRGAATADERADVFSLGVLLYELLTGSVPAGSFTRISDRIGFAKGWDNVLASALSDVPENRTSSVREMRDMIARLWSKEQRRGQWRKRRRLAALLGVVLITGVVATVLTLRAKGPEKFPDPLSATIQRPWTNSLGIQLVPLGPVDGREILMAVTETSLANFSAFHRFEKGSVPEWRLDSPAYASRPGTVVMTPEFWILDPVATPETPGFEITPRHPICGITSVDAWAFCTWLTMKERAQGRISENQRYRLPTTFEWHLASQGELNADGNYAREEAADENWPALRPVGDGRDEFPRSAPVDVLPANPNGLRGMGGNVAEWVLPGYSSEDPGDNDARFIGYSWADPPPEADQWAKARLARRHGFRRTDIGFRIVLECRTVE